MPPADTDFWTAQLEHAQARNALVDNHRFALLSVIFSFHGVILGALMLSVQAMPSPAPNLPRWLWPAISFGILLVGLGLFNAFFSQHLYMLRYKRWIKVLEIKLMVRAGLAQEDPYPQHRGSLYHDENLPDFRADPTIVPLSVIIALLNCGVAALVSGRGGMGP